MASEPIFDKTLSHTLRRSWDSVTLASTVGSQALAHPLVPETLPQTSLCKSTQDDSKWPVHCKAGISNFPSLPRSPSRLSEELPHLPYPLCILTSRLCSKLGWGFLGQLSLVECPRAPQPHRACHGPPRSGGFAASQNSHSQHCLWMGTCMSRSPNEMPGWLLHTGEMFSPANLVSLLCFSWCSQFLAMSLRQPWVSGVWFCFAEIMFRGVKKIFWQLQFSR